MSAQPWEPGDVAAVLANPFYAVQIHESLSRSHEHALSESQWIVSNERGIAEIGSRRWLSYLILALKADHAQGEELGERFAIADPYPAITVHRMLCIEHQPLITESLWLSASVRGLEEDGRAWLCNLLSVLKGVYVVGFEDGRAV